MVVADVMDAGFAAEGVVEVHRAAAGHQEDVAHTPIGEAAEDVIGEL